MYRKASRSHPSRGTTTALIARILGLSLLAAGLGAGLGQVLFSRYSNSSLPTFCLACIGAIVGAIAGAAREIVVAKGRKLSR